VEPIDYEYRTETSESETYSLSGETMTLNHTRYGYELEFAKAIPGESWVLRLLRDDDQRNSTVFKTDMHATEASFSGKVTNISDQDMDKVILVVAMDVADIIFLTQSLKSCNKLFLCHSCNVLAV
jgi:hypothetical protein